MKVNQSVRRKSLSPAAEVDVLAATPIEVVGKRRRRYYPKDCPNGKAVHYYPHYEYLVQFWEHPGRQIWLVENHAVFNDCLELVEEYEAKPGQHPRVNMRDCLSPSMDEK